MHARAELVFLVWRYAADGSAILFRPPALLQVPVNGSPIQLAPPLCIKVIDAPSACSVPRATEESVAS